MVIMTIIGALVLTGIAGFTIYGAFGLWWFLYVGGMEWNWGGVAYCTFWTLVAFAASFMWWVFVGSHLSVSFV